MDFLSNTQTGIVVNTDGTVGNRRVAAGSVAPSGADGTDVWFDTSGSLDWNRSQLVAACDFLTPTAGSMDPFLGAAVSAGTLAAANAGAVTKDRPGVVKLRCGTTANGGYKIQTDPVSLLLGGGEQFDAVWSVVTLTALTMRLGLHDSVTSADAVDGVYFEIAAGGALVAKSSNNSTRTTAGTSFTVVAGTWYRSRVSLNAAGTAVSFKVWDLATQTIVYQPADITTNIPTASGREVGAGIVATNSGTTATDLVHLDYMALSRHLAR